MRNSPKLLAFVLTLLAAACDTERYQPINIAVYPSTMSCAVKEKPVDCTQLGVYLRDTLKATPDREITVSFAGSETVLPDNKSVDRIADVVKKAGFINVRAVHFDL